MPELGIDRPVDDPEGAATDLLDQVGTGRTPTARARHVPVGGLRPRDGASSVGREPLGRDRMLLGQLGIARQIMLGRERGPRRPPELLRSMSTSSRSRVRPIGPGPGQVVVDLRGRPEPPGPLETRDRRLEPGPNRRGRPSPSTLSPAVMEEPPGRNPRAKCLSRPELRQEAVFDLLAHAVARSAGTARAVAPTSASSMPWRPSSTTSRSAGPRLPSQEARVSAKTAACSGVGSSSIIARAGSPSRVLGPGPFAGHVPAAGAQALAAFPTLPDGDQGQQRRAAHPTPPGRTRPGRSVGRSSGTTDWTTSSWSALARAHESN